MPLPDTLWPMPGRRAPVEGTLTPHQAAGLAAKEILDYRGLTQAKAARMDHKMSVKSLSRITGGVPVGPGLLRSLAGILRLPPQTFILMANNDIKGLQSLVMLRPEDDEPVKLLILGIMERVAVATPRRRVTDT